MPPSEKRPDPPSPGSNPKEVFKVPKLPQTRRSTSMAVSMSSSFSPDVLNGVGRGNAPSPEPLVWQSLAPRWNPSSQVEAEAAVDREAGARGEQEAAQGASEPETARTHPGKGHSHLAQRVSQVRPQSQKAPNMGNAGPREGTIKDAAVTSDELPSVNERSDASPKQVGGKRITATAPDSRFAKKDLTPPHAEQLAMWEERRLSEHRGRQRSLQHVAPQESARSSVQAKSEPEAVDESIWWQAGGYPPPPP